MLQFSSMGNRAYYICLKEITPTSAATPSFMYLIQSSGGNDWGNFRASRTLRQLKKYALVNSKAYRAEKSIRSALQNKITIKTFSYRGFYPRKRMKRTFFPFSGFLRICQLQDVIRGQYSVNGMVVMAERKLGYVRALIKPAFHLWVHHTLAISKQKPH